MSTPLSPFPEEEAQQLQPEEPVNPWQGTPQPKWYSGLGLSEDTAYLGPLYQALKGAGQGAAKGEELLGGFWHGAANLGSRYLTGMPQALAELAKQPTVDIQADARERVKALTPDPATTGTAANLIHGISSSLYRYSVGALAGGPLGGAALVGGTEATDRYEALREQGVTPGAAGASAAVTGAFSAAGALLPAGFGSSLLGKILTGAGGNVGFGLLSRYADHKVLEAAGYPAMADQQKVWDSTAMATDLILGGAFGAIAHVHGAPSADETAASAKARIADLETRFGRDAPGVEDAALTTNLASRDQGAGPGVAVDPASANAHAAAMEKSTQDLLAGKPVDVSGTGIDQATFAARPAEDRSNVQSLFVNALKDSGFLDEQANLKKLEESLGARLRGEEPAPETVPRGTQAPATRVPETPEQERAANAAYLPAETEIARAGAKFSDDNANRVALVARAMAADSGRMEALAAQHSGDPNAFIEAARQVIHEHAAVASGGENGAGASAAAAGLERGGGGDGSELRPGGGEPADRNAAGGAEPTARGSTSGGTGAAAEPGAAATGAARIGRIEPTRPVWEMNPDELQSGAKESRTTDIDTLTKIFGDPERAAKYERLANSERDSAYEAATKMYDAATPEQRAALDAWERGEGAGAFSAKELEGHARSMRAVEAETPEELGENLRYAITKVGNKTNPAEMNSTELEGYMQMRHGLQSALERGWDLNAVSKSAIEAAARRFPDKNDAADMLARYLPERTVAPDPLADPAHQAVEDNPAMQIPDESGRLVSAKQALDEADQAVTQGASDWQTAVTAAINCFSRKGGG